MENHILNNDDFWKELGLDPEALGIPGAAPEDAVLPEEPSAEAAVPVMPEPETKPVSRGAKIAGVVAGFLAAVVCTAATLGVLAGVALMSGGKSAASGSVGNVTIMDKFDMFMTNQISNALDGVLSIKKVYWLSDSDQVAPKPDPDNYGTAATPGELMWLLEEAKDLIGDQEMLFNENTPVYEKEPIRYYYDETILVITWKQVVDRGMYTMSEVRIAHPSQFRRFLAGGEFGSDKLYATTDMAASVNAVVATSGDYYRFRRNGAVVYEGQLRRFEGKHVDTCFINADGDLLFAYRGDLETEEQALKFVTDNNVRFSMAFGPILVDDGKACAPASYTLGEIRDRYSRAALCQLDTLHYLLVSAGGGGGVYEQRHTIGELARNLEAMGVEKAYALDGGQTTVIAMDGKLINFVDFGNQRLISDIIYFATAMPEGT